MKTKIMARNVLFVNTNYERIALRTTQFVLIAIDGDSGDCEVHSKSAEFLRQPFLTCLHSKYALTDSPSLQEIVTFYIEQVWC